MTYTTQMHAAKLGIVTPQMKAVAQKEGMEEQKLIQLLAQGRVVIPANRHHASLLPEGIGKGLRTKINVNLGISRDCRDFETELNKVRKALALQAESIMDLSSFGKTFDFREKLLKLSTAMVGTVPIYDAVGFLEKDLATITPEEFLKVIRTHAEQGVDFMTIHAGITRETAAHFKKNPRTTNIVSRGGSLIFARMEMTGRENPFYEYYDEILDIFAEHDVTVSLGDACRPGCIDDATDASQIQELLILGELTQRARAKNVQVMVEGPGHMAMNEIAANMLLAKKLCHNAPFYVLGPIVTDVAPGYDHITSAVGGAIAAANGADFLCCVTPAEHLRLPDAADMKEGIIAAKIAAHAADIAKNVPGAREWDNRMARARCRVDWEEMFREALDEDKARAYRESSPTELSDTCSMCGKMCAVRNMNRILSGEDVHLI